MRFERESLIKQIDYDDIYVVEDIEQACEIANEKGNNIFIGTGSKNLDKYIELIKGKKLIARVLPTSDVLKSCEELGLNADNIIAMKGPFTEEINIATYRQYDIDLLITKESGVAGGFLEQHDQQIEQVEVNGIALVDGEKIFGEVVGGQKKIVICGGGHVSMPIIQLGRQIGCYVTVLEDRPKFADNARRAGADKVICDTFEAGLEQIPGDSDTFFVIVTRGHVYDRICLESIVRKPHAYIGMMGSRRRVAQVKHSVLENGADPQVISQLHSPIGLDIKAETPEEIAISVMAEIIQVKNQDKRGAGYSNEIRDAIVKCEDQKKILATIVERKGSAPRSIGTKMLIMEDGRCVDTIGGGCIEAAIVSKALLILRGCAKAPQIVHVDMTGEDAEKEGMVCGGKVKVLLEEV